MSRYIDADAFSIEPLKQSSIEFDAGIVYALRKLDEQPTANVVEVVRCKDCEFWQTDWLTSYDGYHYCAMVDIITDGDFYCKDGERKILPKD